MKVLFLSVPDPLSAPLCSTPSILDLQKQNLPSFEQDRQLSAGTCSEIDRQLGLLRMIPSEERLFVRAGRRIDEDHRRRHFFSADRHEGVVRQEAEVGVNQADLALDLAQLLGGFEVPAVRFLMEIAPAWAGVFRRARGHNHLAVGRKGEPGRKFIRNFEFLLRCLRGQVPDLETTTVVQCEDSLAVRVNSKADE